MSELEIGIWVERRRPRHPGERLGRITGQCHPDGDAWYVTVAPGFSHIDQGRDLRPADLPPSLTGWWTQR